MIKKRKINIRTIIQALFFLIIAFISVNHTLVKDGKGIALLSSASLHAICPFGGVVTIYQYATTGTFVKKLHESSFVLMILMFILAVGFGPLFCGWICPFGTLQEVISKIGKKIFKRKHNNFMPYKYDKYLRFLRYLILIRVAYMTAATGNIIFSQADPYYALFNFWTSEASILSIAILMIIALASLFIERPWCKYACPYGAALGITNLFRIFKIKRNSSTCLNCGACNEVCPMNIKISREENVRNNQCISCMKCTSEEVCPVKYTVSMSLERVKSYES